MPQALAQLPASASPTWLHRPSTPTAAHLGHLDDVGDVQVGLHGGQAAANEVGFVSFLSVHLARVLLGVDSHRADAQLRAGPEHPDGDLTLRQRGENLGFWVLGQAEAGRAG